jgi:hypothetical protein
VVLYRTAPHVLRANRPRLEGAIVDATGGFVGNAAGWAYENGRLGPPVWKGGDGTAERRYLETMALVSRQFARLTDFAAERTRWKLLCTYLPFPDEALHAWYGRLDATLPGHDPAAAAALRPHVDAMLRLVDGYLGHVVRRAEKDGAILAVGADHGMTSVARLVRPNVLLARAGLLALDGDGAIDLARSRAVYAGNSGYVMINRADRPGGIVAPAEEPSVRRAVREALLAARDGAVAPIVDVLDASRPPPGSGIGGPRAGDLYVTLAPAYDFNARASGDPFEAYGPRGTHFQRPEDPRMLASFVIAGPGIAAGVDLGVIRQVDVAPTLAAALGLDPPAHAVGRVLVEAFAR